MSIINTFDSKSAEILTARDMIQQNSAIPETVISVFTEDFIELLKDTMNPTVVGALFAGAQIPIYSFQYC